ncbi:Uncharacterised protein [[Clostridium] sordellii]|uniref:hypothetical protein n=1 Tax=Paraclostridium sordellii TaxID=1505 RepID=UPI0005E9FDFF|nr:hypothetical protein [Paeniclostridium sordellii]MBX9180823.1 hypothetical protein [Paeniclostridium sordellii]CEO08622.1 Uncharacterised protein [[Clostridium] sordellii] [Paeniclostridium sordellii]CEP84896.1 Uncharacterised protein [[Clostridium] sordellii] [Paeniclostridium sordellii]
MNLIVKDIYNDNKFNDLLKKYIEFASIKGIRTGNILFLVPNNKVKREYDKNINLNISEEIKTTTYISFISKEVIKFWPMIEEKCNEILEHRLKPITISSSLRDYILTEIVKQNRNFRNYFEDITASNRNIANSISDNLNKAVQNIIDIKSIGEKIYYSKVNHDKINRFSYSEMQEVIDKYISLLLSNSIIDNSLMIYLYNNYLLKDERYLSFLRKDIKYLLVDSLENSTVCEVEFISRLLDEVNDSYMYINYTKDYAAFNNIDMKYINEKIVSRCKVINNCSINSLYLSDLKNLNKKIELNQDSQLYSEMIKHIGDKIIELVKKDINPQDISIICPISSTVIYHKLKILLEKNDIHIYNTKQDKRLIDYPYAHALMVASCIFYECEEILNNDDYINFISLLTQSNKIRAMKIFNDKQKSEDYINIINYIKEKKGTDLSIYEFLIKFYIDNLLNLPNGKENVKICKKIIQESENFTESISLLGLDKDKSKEKIFFEALKSNIKDYYSLSEIEDFQENNSVVLTTPYRYISQNMKNPIQIWVDVGSNMWSMKCEKEISNVQVLKRTFKDSEIYTEDMEEFYKEYYLYNTIYNLLINTETVYAYKSEYTLNGYIQEGLLYNLIISLIDKGEFDE